MTEQETPKEEQSIAPANETSNVVAKNTEQTAKESPVVQKQSAIKRLWANKKIKIALAATMCIGILASITLRQFLIKKHLPTSVSLDQHAPLEEHSQNDASHADTPHIDAPHLESESKHNEQANTHHAAKEDMAIADLQASDLTPKERYKLEQKLYTSGQHQLKKGRLEAALKYFNLALVLSPKNIYIMMAVASAYYDFGNYTQALSAVQQVLSINPHYSPAYFLLGSIHHADKNYQKAKEAYQQYLSDDPQGSFAQDAKGMLAALK